MGKFFDRITRSNDIAGIELHYEDDTSEEIYPHWHSTDKYDIDNEYQKSRLSDRGDLLVLITENNEKLQE